jgi:hypothetical protein
MMQRFYYRVFCMLCFFTTTVVHNSYSQPPAGYPKITGYVGILHPLVTFGHNEKPHYNFDGAYVAKDLPWLHGLPLKLRAGMVLLPY